MPDFSVGIDEPEYGNITGLANASSGMATQMPNTAPQGYGAATTLGGDAFLGIIDLVDSVASSIPGVSRVTGLQRGQVTEKMVSKLDLPGLTRFYNQNRGGVEVASGIYGIIASELVTRKALLAAKPVIAGLKTLPFARRLATLDDQYNLAMAGLQAAEAGVAARGTIGARALKELTDVPVAKWGAKGGLTTELRSVALGEARRKVRVLGAAQGAMRVGASEATLAFMMNSNDFLYSDDWATNALFAGLGIGAGAAFGRYTSNYAIQKFSASDELNRLRAEALDPTGMERATAGRIGEAPVNQTRYLGAMQGTRTDEVTSLMVRALATPEPGVDRTMFSQMSTGLLGEAFTVAEKVTQRGVTGVKDSAFIIGRGAETTPEGRLLKAALKHDEGALFGVEMVGRKADDLSWEQFDQIKSGAVQERIDTIQSRLQDPKLTDDVRAELLTEMKQLKFNQQTVMSILMPDGQRMPKSYGQTLDKWEAPVVKSKDFAGSQLWEAFDSQGKNFGIGIDENLEISFTKGRSIKDISKLDFMDVMRAHRIMGQTVKDLSTQFLRDPKKILVLPKKPNWMQLDAAEDLMQLTDGQAKIQWGGGVSREQAQVESFAQKVDFLRGLSEDYARAQRHTLGTMLNLPTLTAYEMGRLGTQRHPLDVIARGAIAKGGGDAVRGMSLIDLKQAFVEARNLNDLTQFSATDVKSLKGNSSNFLLDDLGREVKPIAVYSRSLRPQEWIRDDLADRILLNKFQQAKALTAPGAGDLTRNASTAIYSSPDLQLAAQLSGVNDINMTASVIPGTGNVVPSSAGGALINAATSMEQRARNAPAVKAAMRLNEAVNAISRDHFRNVIESHMGDTLQTLAGPRALQTRTLLDQFHSPGVASGWDLLPNPTPIKQGDQTLYGFTLEDTARNRTRFERQFGRKMPKGQQLISPNETVVVLDELGLDIQRRLNAVTDQRRIETNSLLRAQGLPEVRRTEWYIPPPNVEGKFIAYTFGADGKTIQGGTIIAKTQAELDRLVAKMKADPKSVANQPGAIVRGRTDVEAYSTLWDRAQMELVDANAPVNQSGKKSQGLLGGPEMVSGSFRESLETLRSQYLRHGTETLQVVMADQIKGAKLRSQIAQGEIKSKTSWFSDTQFKNSYDYWLQALQGKSPLAGNQTHTAPIFNTIEAGFNRIMAEAAPTSSAVWHAMTDWLTRRMPWGRGVEDRKAFEQLSTHLGNFMPFDDVAKMVENKKGAVNPLTLAGLTGTANKFTATWMLRMLETAHPVMNLSGILAAAPAVIRNFQPRAGESAAEFAQRVGHSATIFQTPGGRTVASLDMGKLALRGFQRAWSRASDASFDRLSRKGMLSQEVAEFQKQFNAIESPSTMKAFFMGDDSIKAPKTLGEKYRQKGAVGWMSILSDKSEDFSRSWAHFIGEELGEQLGLKLGSDALDNFAHDVANKMIANYNPFNRAEVFQGAIGAPFGLFQSFMVNYWERMFRYVETGDLKSMAIQAATSASLFGTAAIPGWSEAQDFFFSHSDGKTSPMDALMNKFGPDAGDVLMGGTLGNLPMLFGGEGAALYSRGDVAARLPVANAAPALSAIMKIKEGMGAAIDMFADQNPGMSQQQLGEILSNALPNRPLAGMVETFMAGGKDTDPIGQLVSENHSTLESVYRMLGLKSMRQSKELEAYYLNKQAQEIKASQDDVLRESSRSLIRSGREDALPRIFETYLENGGDPRNFRRWYMDNYDSATQSHGRRQLDDLGSMDKIMRDPDKMRVFQRLMDFEVGISEDDATEDPYDSMTQADPMNSTQPTASETDDGHAYSVPTW